MTDFITKESISRLLSDVKQIIKNPLSENGIYYVHDDTDMLKGYALIIGPEDTPYFGGFYFFEFKFPNDYPHSPPRVTYCTNGNNIRFNPNLYKCGKVCVSLLNTWSGEQWTSCQTISTVLLTLCTLLCKNPLLNEPGVTENHRELDNYTKIIEYSNIDVAVCDIMNKKNGLDLSFFEHFTEVKNELFLKNVDKILEFIEMKIKDGLVGNKDNTINGGFYNMSVKLDYVKLKKRVIGIKNNIEKIEIKI
jgi:ubiquitin-conjugating enzyme E2 Z